MFGAGERERLRSLEHDFLSLKNRARRHKGLFKADISYHAAVLVDVARKRDIEGDRPDNVIGTVKITEAELAAAAKRVYMALRQRCNESGLLIKEVVQPADGMDTGSWVAELLADRVLETYNLGEL